jgi:hypothetical protein
MAKSQVITEEMIEAALALLDKRIAEPPPPSAKSYSRRDAFLKLRGRAKDALAAGHSLETVLDDLKGIGIGMTISTARQYLKPGRKSKKPANTSPLTAISIRKSSDSNHRVPREETAKPKGTFTVTEDEINI